MTSHSRGCIIFYIGGYTKQSIYIFNEPDKVLFKDVLIGIYNLFDKLIE